ncbi:MAG: UDP-N-acetylmuramate dehydrogenase [Endomicrobium sp.]|nr:UDP-N-acetylmuramate dehydrogenase [Endomicrobium sp.]
MEKRRRVINADLVKELSFLGCKVLEGAPLYKYSSFKIGGNADFLLEIPNEKALLFCLENISTYRYMILGDGTNVLFSDNGYRGIIIRLIGEFRNIKTLQEVIVAGAGASLQQVLNNALKNNLVGLESVAGIPGTVGAAVYGNVGKRDEWIGTFVDNIEVYKDAKKKCLSKDQISFSYRKSNLEEEYVITKVKFLLKKDTKNDSLNMVNENIHNRVLIQPLDMPNAGSIFKNPTGYSVGKLIEESNLKGFQIGGAKISNKHGNFIVNTGQATSKDVLALINLIKEKIKLKFNITLETEVKIINDK